MPRRFLFAFLAGLGLLACLDEPEFKQVGDNAPAAAGDTTTTTTPPSGASSQPDATANGVPDGGVAGPGKPCGKQICAAGRVCCKDRCKEPESTCD